MIKIKYNLLLSIIIRFSIIGVISTIVNDGFFSITYKILGLHYIFSSSTGYLIGLLLGYYFNKHWTLINKVIIGKAYISKYSISQLAGLVFYQVLLLSLVGVLHFNLLLANIIAICFAAIISFIIIDLIVFNSTNYI